MSDKKLECDNCDTTYLDEKGDRRCARHKHKTEGYYAEDICVEGGYYYPKGKEPDAKPDRTASFDIFR